MTENFNKIKLEIQKKSIVAGISSDEVAYAKSLVDGKNKNKKIFICEGLWAADKLIEKKLNVTHFFFNSEKLAENQLSNEELEKILRIVKYSKQSFAISEKACKKISDRDGFDEFFIVAELPVYTLNDLTKMFEGKNNVLGIIMDGLEQPGNIGAILRTCDAAGADFAISTNIQARLSNSRLVRSSFGAVFMIPVLEAEIEDVQNWLVENHFKSVVTDLQGKKSFKDADYSGRVVIVAGNEHTGISASWRNVEGAESVIIPMLGSVESLNVGFATTLVAYEAGLKKFGNKK
ncbi:MAG: hypothetical protein IJ538_03235 [Clostridia bacterium]|nr:hypothetical protein [Clostridia bacterium]